MQTKDLIREIKRLPLSKRFFVIEQTLKSIKEEELQLHADKSNHSFIDNNKEKELMTISHLVSEISLAKDWLSEEDKRWDKIL